MNWKPALSLSTVLLLLVSVSCKKTVDLEPLPQNEITAFKVTNLQDTVIYGAIDNTNKSITVYLPFFYGLNVIDPEITVSPGASVVEEILPVPVESENTTYTVKGPDGSLNKYQLIIVQQNTPSLEISWEQQEPVSFPLGEIPFIRGNFMTTNRALVQVQLEHIKKGKTVTMHSQNGAITLDPSANWYMLSGLKLPADIDTGAWQVKIDFLDHHRTLPEPLLVQHRQPDFLAATRVVKQGETITFNAFNSVFLDPVKAIITVDGTAYSVPIAGYSLQEIALSVPDDFPTGNHYAAYSLSFNNWATVTRYGSLTVNPR